MVAARHFLDDFDYGRAEAVELRNLLAKAYGARKDIEPLVERLGIEPTTLFFEQAPVYVWHEILRQASAALSLRDLLRLVLGDGTRKKFHARIEEMMAAVPVVEAPGSPGGPPPDVTAGELERILAGASTLVDIALLRGALRVAPAVARLEVAIGANRYHGTGFLIEAEGLPLLLTNHHVLFDVLAEGRRASRVDAWFSYETGDDGAPRQPLVVAGDPSTITSNQELDWAALRLVQPLPGAYPGLRLTATSAPEEGQPAFIIQHPRGLVKQIGLTRNQIQHVDERVVRYLTDTEAGSSGAPVFNERWEVIALHHSWVEIPQEEGRQPAYQNEGIRTDQVRAGLVAAGLLPA